MAGAAVRQGQALPVRPVIHPLQFNMAIDAGKILVRAAHQMLAGDVKGQLYSVPNHFVIRVVMAHLTGLVVLGKQRMEGQCQ